jgi:HEAT repeat protein
MQGKEATKSAEIRQDLEKAGSKSKRRKRIAQLGEAGEVDAVEPLLELCEDVGRKERSAIKKALVEIASADESGMALRVLVDHGLASEGRRMQRCTIRTFAELGPFAQPVCDDLLFWLEDPGRLAKRERAELAEAVAGIGGVSVAALLVRLLETDEPEVRASAAHALGRLEDPSALDALRRAFASPETPSNLRVAILESWPSAFGEDIVPFLTAAARDEDSSVGRQAVRCLNEIDSTVATRHLIELGQDFSAGKRRDLVLKGLRKRYKEMLAAVQEGQVDLLPLLLDVWRSLGKKSRVSAEIFEGLVAVGKALVPGLRDTLDGASPAADVLRVLERIGADSQLDKGLYPKLIAELDNPDRATASAAARILGMLGDERAIPVLAARLAFDPELLKAKGRKAKAALKGAFALQQGAAIGLGRLGRSALAVAMEAAHSDNPVARRGGVIVLGRVGGGRALAVLDRAVDDPEPVVREAAARALDAVMAGDLRRLESMLKNKDERVRAKAAHALGKMDDLRSLDLLLRAYGDSSDKVNRVVIKALARREGERSLAMLVAAAAGGSLPALQSLEKNPDRQSIPALFEALDSPWSDVYTAALHALRAYVERFGADPEAMAALRERGNALCALLLDDSSKVRKLAAEILSAIGGPGYVRDLALLLVDARPDVREATLQALRSIGGDEVMQVIEAHLVEDGPEGREEGYREVARVLQKLGVDESLAGSG